MKMTKIAVLSLIAVGLIFTFAFAAGDVEKGKALFNNPKLGSGTSGKTCNSCHPDGEGLEQTPGKKTFKTPGGVHKTIEEAVNVCIKMTLKGKAIDPKSADMANIVAYIKSLKDKKAAPTEKPMKKKVIEGC